jgi:hypothetical protein
VLNLVDKCGPEKMAVVGAICPASASVIVETTKAPTKVDTPTEPVKKVEETVVPKEEVAEATKPIADAKDKPINDKVEVKTEVKAPIKVEEAKTPVKKEEVKTDGDKK